MCFSFIKRRLERKMFIEMEKLLRQAKVCMTLKIAYEVNNSIDEESSIWGVAVADDLFGVEPNENTIAKLDITEVRKYANRYLELNLDDRELIVQSIRVRTTIQYYIKKRFPEPYDRCEEILSMYGDEFKDIPNIGVYRPLVLRTIHSLPPAMKDLLSSHIKATKNARQK